MLNCIINADFNFSRGIVILKNPDTIVIENPGSIIAGKAQMLKGGISEPRNKTIMKMFNLIKIGERAGSGVPDIFDAWEEEGWVPPMVEEQYRPDRTILTLGFERTEKGSRKKEPKKGAKKEPKKGAEKKRQKGAERKKDIIKIIKGNPKITQVKLMEELDLSRKQVQSALNELKNEGVVTREGSNRNGIWTVNK